MKALSRLRRSDSYRSWRRRPGFDDHEFVMALSDEASGLKAFIAIHNTNLGPALGGTRMQKYASEAAALDDVLDLSRAMSYKCALAKLPYGGGKAVIMADPGLDREAVLSAYARLVEKLGGLLKTGTDVGISDDDVAHMAKQTEHMLGVKPADRGDLNTSKVAALGVFHAMKATLRHLDGSSSFAGKRIAIKGVGKLGGELARLVREAGGLVYIADINSERCQELRRQWPDVTVVANGEIHRCPVDIYSPCALGNEFNSRTISQLRCRAIAGGANNQLVDPSAGDLLHRRRILYAPDYIANAGGLIYVADELEKDGFKAQRVIERTEAIEQTLADIFRRTELEKLPTHRVADMLAEERLRKAGHA